MENRAKEQTMRRFRALVGTLVGMIALLGGAIGCNSIDCPLDNVVVVTYGLYDAETSNKYTLADTLTVTNGARNAVLLNRATGVSSFTLPASYSQDTDTIVFQFFNASGQSANDTIFYKKTNTPHFEDITCPSAIFHTLTEVSWTSHAISTMPLTIDRVEIVRPTVNYDDVENFKVYLRSK